jgi:predicted ATP-grasp superfamily ATP-dependent carboligase
MVTDLPAAMTAILAGDTSLGDYLRSLRKCRTEAVFSSDDLWPGLVEILLIPYLAVKRGF